LGFTGIANGASNWSLEAPLPVPLFDLAAAAGPNGTIFAIGGQEFGGLSAAVYVYRPSVKQWVAGPALPAPRYDHAAAVGSDGRIYVIGGRTVQGYPSSVLALKPGTGGRWTSVAPLPTPRAELGAAMGPDGRIYVVGGRVFPEIFDVLEIYDPATNKWTTGAPMPTPRFGMGVARGGDGRIYAIGGWGETSSGTAPLKVVEAYSPATNSWTKVAPLPSPRVASTATSLGGLIYVISGCEGKSGGRCATTRRVDVYSPKQNKWWTLPPTQAAHVEAAAVTGRRRVFVIGGSTDSVESRPSLCSVCQ
jgi:N-acetylneuraminic acid mutarotase